MEKQKSASIATRRSLLKGLGAAATSTALGMWSKPGNAQDRNIGRGKISDKFRDNSESLIIAKVESIRFSDKINIGGGSGGDGKAEFCWVRITTNTGIIGMGETYPSIEGELGALRDIAATYLIGKDPRDIDKIWKELYKYQRMR